MAEISNHERRVSQLNVFHNTTDEPEEIRKDYELKAGSQDALVYEFFRSIRAAHAPTMVWDSLISQGLISEKTPLTSIRRAISNLARAGLLVKTSVKMQGNYGRLENTWRFLK
jgi:hypothetical protein